MKFLIILTTTLSIFAGMSNININTDNQFNNDAHLIENYNQSITIAHDSDLPRYS